MRFSQRPENEFAVYRFGPKICRRESMKEIRDIVRLFELHRGERFALGTLVAARGSSYRRPGARMLICGDGTTAGSLSGGCLEEEVARRARDVMHDGGPALLTF